MKKIYLIILIVISMLVTTVSTVSAAPKNLSVIFLGGVWTEGGVVFTFRVDETLSGSGWWKGRVSWDGGSAQMTCGNQDGDRITCSAPRTVADKYITVTFQESSFKTYVKSRDFCYGVWVWADNTGENWVNAGQHCQEEPAQLGDTIAFNTPYPDPSPPWNLNPFFLDFDLLSNSGCYNPYVGPAYYESVFVC